MRGVQRSRLRLLDPHETLFERWRHVTANVGMAFLRSPSVHHIGLEADELHRFAQSSAGRWLAEYRDPYHRPSLTLFDAHADNVVRTKRLDELYARCYRKRRRQLQEGRYRGTMPHDVARELLQAVESGRVEMKIAEVMTCTTATDSSVHLQLATGEMLSAEHVVLATGFDQTRPGSPWLDAVIANEGLPCAPCGYQIPDKTLVWVPGLYVNGALAELELGATAPNIRGAQMAAERLLRVADSL